MPSPIPRHSNPSRIWATCVHTVAFLGAALVAFAMDRPGVAWPCLVLAVLLATFTA